MKKIFPACLPILALVLSLAPLVSCRQNKEKDAVAPAGSYYVRFKLNGVQKEFTSETQSTVNKATAASRDIYMFEMVGVKNWPTIDKNNLSILISHDQRIEVNTTYTNYLTSAAGFTRADLATLAYFDEAGKSYLSYDQVFSAAGTKSDFRAKITELNGKTVKGTFTGTLYSSDLSETLVITEGEFMAKRLE